MKSIILSLSLLVTTSAFAQEIPTIKTILQKRTEGSEPFYAQVLAPSLSLETEKAKIERIKSSNAELLKELELVSKAFTAAKSADTVKAVYDVVTKIDSEVPGKGGHITFLGTNPSAAVSRNLFLLEKAKLTTSTDPVNDVLGVLTSYKRSAKPSDYLYEYADAKNLTTGNIVEIEGSDESWQKPEAAAPFRVKEDYAIKKCRQILGWRCITSLYRVDTVKAKEFLTHILFISLYDLEKNKDNPEFTDDRRSKNQINGTTAVYIVKESKEWVMIYAADYQYNNDKNSFTGAIQSEFQKDVGRFKDRLSQDLGIKTKDIK